MKNENKINAQNKQINDLHAKNKKLVNKMKMELRKYSIGEYLTGNDIVDMVLHH